jgi:hypothetical protein
MNPLLWKREHQLALVSSALLGGIIGGLLFVLVFASPYMYDRMWCGFGSHGWACWINGYVLRVVMWAALGALVGPAIIYIRQLLRA